MPINSATKTSRQQSNTSVTDNLADHALVFMFSSMFAQISQPIGMFTCKGATPSHVLASLILTAMIACERAGARIHAIVCDEAQTNRGLWKHFGIKAKLGENLISCFENPADMDGIRKIYFISDVPHLFKCIRNNLLMRKEFKVIKNFYLVSTLRDPLPPFIRI